MIALAAAEPPDTRRWLVSAAVVLAVHATVVAIMLKPKDPILSAEPAAAIVVEFAPLAVAPSAELIDVAPGPQQETTEQVPVETPELVEKPVAGREVTLAPPEEPKIEAPPAPQPEVVVPPAKPVRHEAPKPPRRNQPAQTRSAPRPEQATAAIAAAPTQGLPSDWVSNALPSWKGQVVAILQRNKRYPAEAEARHEQGTAQLAFSIDRRGHVTASRIARSSGFPALDQETLALVRRASPFPPPPPDVRGAQISLTVPIRFAIR